MMPWRTCKTLSPSLCNVSNFDESSFYSHPNTWIKESAEKYIAFISDPANKVLTAAEIYCQVRPDVKRIKKHQKNQVGVKLWEKDQTNNNAMHMKNYRVTTSGLEFIATYYAYSHFDYCIILLHPKPITTTNSCYDGHNNIPTHNDLAIP